MHPETRNLSDPAPREVGLFTKATVLFGGFMQQFGWIFFTLGSLFSWLFIPLSDVRYWFESKRNWAEVPGRIIAVEPANASVNEQPVYRYGHAFELEGKSYTGSSYTYGEHYLVGDEVVIKYRIKVPEVSYVQGARRSVFPAFVLFVLIFPAAGLAFIIPSLRQNWKAIRLLESGVFTRARMTAKEDTNSSVKINNTTYPVYKYTFEFSAAGKTFTATCRTHQGWKVEDEDQEIVLYDRFNPAYNIIYDAVANMPDISSRGVLEPVSAWRAVNLVLPVLGIGLNAYFIFKGSPLIIY